MSFFVINLIYVFALAFSEAASSNPLTRWCFSISATLAGERASTCSNVYGEAIMYGASSSFRRAEKMVHKTENVLANLWLATKQNINSHFFPPCETHKNIFFSFAANTFSLPSLNHLKKVYFIKTIANECWMSVYVLLFPGNVCLQLPSPHPTPRSVCVYELVVW